LVISPRCDQSDGGRNAFGFAAELIRLILEFAT
jgi:hypothetical protein